MPSYKELQKELIRKNDQILRLSETNNNLRDSNAKLTLQNEEYKDRNANLSYRVKHSERVMLIQDEEIEKLRAANRKLIDANNNRQGIYSSKYAREHEVTIRRRDGKFMYLSLQDLVSKYLGLIDQETLLTNKLEELQKQNMALESRNKELLDTACKNEDIVIVLHDGTKKVFSIDSLVREYSNLYMESMEGLPLGKRTVSYISNSKVITKTVSSLLDDYVDLLKDTQRGRYTTELKDKTVFIRVGGESRKFTIGTLIEEYVRISKQLAYMCVPDPKSSVLRELATENDKLNTEIDMYKSAINDLYNLAAGEKGYL